MAQNGTFFPVETTYHGKYICILIDNVTDVCHYQTQLKRTLIELEKISRVDGLIQIYNRRYWQ